uniref:Uncharacterized protein n=1 Tax=Amphimedon queenslandica TaxID=400682 RepID=A0A1X7UN74_AMPQE
LYVIVLQNANLIHTLQVQDHHIKVKVLLVGTEEDSLDLFSFFVCRILPPV